MAQLLNDKEITELLGSVIENGDKACVRPNSYVLRLGAAGEFHTTGKVFELGTGPNDKKGIVVSPGQSVALTALETINFTRETVKQHFPDCDLHGIVSPTTDLQREGVVAPTTQVDAGYRGTLNWTLSFQRGAALYFRRETVPIVHLETVRRRTTGCPLRRRISESRGLCTLGKKGRSDRYASGGLGGFNN